MIDGTDMLPRSWILLLDTTWYLYRVIQWFHIILSLTNNGCSFFIVRLTKNFVYCVTHRKKQFVKIYKGIKFHFLLFVTRLRNKSLWKCWLWLFSTAIRPLSYGIVALLSVNCGFVSLNGNPLTRLLSVNINESLFWKRSTNRLNFMMIYLDDIQRSSMAPRSERSACDRGS
jgi:hypothetical protein